MQVDNAAAALTQLQGVTGGEILQRDIFAILQIDDAGRPGVALQSRVHLAAAATAAEVHTGHEHADSQLRPFLRTFRGQFLLHRHVFRGGEGKLQPKVLQSLGQFDAYVEIHQAGR